MADNGLLSQAKRLLSSAPLMLSNLLGTDLSTPRTNSGGSKRDGHTNSGSRKVKFNDDSNQVKTVSRYLKPKDTFDPYSEGIYAANGTDSPDVGTATAPTVSGSASAAPAADSEDAPIVVDDDVVDVDTDDEMGVTPDSPPVTSSHSHGTPVSTHAVQHNAPHHGTTPAPVPTPSVPASGSAPVHGFGILSASPQLQADVPSLPASGHKRARLMAEAPNEALASTQPPQLSQTAVPRAQQGRQQQTSVDIVRIFMWRGRRKLSRPGHSGPVMQPVRMPGYEPPQVGTLERSAFAGKVSAVPAPAWMGGHSQVTVVDTPAPAYVPKAQPALDLVSSSILAISAASVQPLPAQDQVASAALARMAGGFATFRPGVSPSVRRRQASHPRSLFAASKATARPSQAPAQLSITGTSELKDAKASAVGPEDMTRMIMEALGTIVAPPAPAHDFSERASTQVAEAQKASGAFSLSSVSQPAAMPSTSSSGATARVGSEDRRGHAPDQVVPNVPKPSAQGNAAATPAAATAGEKTTSRREEAARGKDDSSSQFDSLFQGSLSRSMSGFSEHVVDGEWQVSFDAF